MAKIDPNGLEALRNGIEEALTKNTYSRDTRLVKKYTTFVLLRAHVRFDYQNEHFTK